MEELDKHMKDGKSNWRIINNPWRW
jgi:hypothetical protein